MNKIGVSLLLVLALAGCGAGESGDEAAAGGDPAFETARDTLDSKLVCLPFTHPDKPAVLLVHGTFTTGFEQYDWTYLPLLDQRGFDVCVVTYPDRGLGDMQISAEYVANALMRMHERTGRKVAVIGHSQGVAVPRWAIKWWPSARAAVDDFVMQAGPNQGTVIADPLNLLNRLGIPLPEGTTDASLLPQAFHQFGPTSDFMRATNAGDQTPGDISYTAIYTLFDELVEPALPLPVPAGSVDYEQGNPNVTNLLLQDLCPLKITDHVTIGTIDKLAFELTLDAISNPGPLNVERAGGAKLCGLLPIVPELILPSNAVTQMLGILAKDAANGAPNPHLASGEPPLKPYAQGALSP